MFPDRAWLYVGKQLLEQPAGLVGVDGAGPYDAAAALLGQRPAGAWKRVGLDLLLSDEMARVVTLPWQDGLRTTEQQLRYAEACLEDAGVYGAGWTVQYGYRRYGRGGIAFAVQTDTLMQLADLAAAHQLRLRSVLPSAAAAYWRHALAGGGETLLVLSEARRVSALRFAGGGLLGLDVQPVMDSTEIALRRLLRRAQLQGDGLATISCWSTGDPAPAQAAAGECYPAVRLRVLPHGSLG